MKEYIEGVVQIGDAISSLSPKAQWVCYENDIDRIEWTDDSIPQPSNAEIEAEVKRLQAEYSANQYQRSRASEFPSIPDQLDEIYHNVIDSWKAVIKVTKDKYPKG